MSVLISIIVPIYNAEKYLSRCVDSLLAQTLSDIEIILVNDGSTDNSFAIIEDYARNDKRIKTLTQQNAGVSTARNAGIAAATGKYIGFIDADDEVKEDMFEKLFNSAVQENADIAMCEFYSISNGISTVVSLPINDGLCNREEYFEKLIFPMIMPYRGKDREYGVMGNVWRCIYRSEICKEIYFLQREELCWEDLFFNITFATKVNKCVIVKEPLYLYYTVEGSLSRGYKDKYLERILSLCRHIELVTTTCEYKEDILERVRVLRIFSTWQVLLNILEMEQKSTVSDLISRYNIVVNNVEIVNSYKYLNLRKFPAKNYIIFYLIKLRLSKPLLLIALILKKIKR